MNSTCDNSHAQANAFSKDQGQKARLFVYENLRYVGESAFTKESILIGKSSEADLVLDHQSIADIHALIQIGRDQVLLINKNIGNGLRLNGLAIKESALHAEDVIQLGPFSIIFKPVQQPVTPAATFGRITERVTYYPKAAKEISSEPPAKEISRESSAKLTAREPAAQPGATRGTFAVILVDHYASAQARRDAVTQLAALFRAGESAIERLMSRPRPVLKRNLDRLTAFRLQDTLHDVGILSMVRAQDPFEAQSAVNKTMGSQVRALASTTSVPIRNTEPPPADRFPAPTPGVQTMAPDEDEEEGEEIWEAPFILKERLLGASPQPRGAQRGASQVQVIKTLDDAIVDIAFVNKGQKYYLHRPKGRLCLVENRADEQAFLYIDPLLSGQAMADGRARSDLDHYRTDAYLHRRRKEVYRLPFSARESALVSDGRCQYHLSLVEERVSPGVKTAVQAKPVTWRHWASSVGTHLLVVLCLSGYFFFHSATPQKQTLHFVKVDLEALRALEPKEEIRPEPKKEPPPPTPTPEPQRIVETVKPTEKKIAAKVTPRNAPKTATPKTAPQEAAQAQSQPSSRDPNAGGGFGEGNIANRNVNQTGILSILSKNAVPGPSAAMASVTNLDAVQVPGATEKNFTVGGIKGSLGSGKISMGGSGAIDPSSIVQTKGSQQVLRSAGAGGSGEVAALERGTTGQKQVKAMVTAKMTQTVKIEGGMSREMVKQVIDQHLGEITFCYESALAANPNIMGRVIFEWKILLSGRVGEIRIVASNINSNEIHDCIKSAIKSWQFPNPVGAEVIVSYPFVFDLVAF